MSSIKIQTDNTSSSHLIKLLLPYLTKDSFQLTNGDNLKIVDGEVTHTEWDKIVTYLVNKDKHAFNILIGDESRKVEVETWINYQKNELLPSLNVQEKNKLLPALHKLNKKLEPLVFLASNRFSLADLVLFPFLQPLIKKWTEPEQHIFDSISRYYDNIQHLKEIHPTIKDLGLEITIQKDVPKNVPKTKGETQKKEGEGQNKGGGGKKKADSSKALTFSRLDLRVGKIVDIEKHPDANSLYKEKIDVGEAVHRTVISGLVKYIPMEELKDRLVVVICNLKPVNMRGIKSEAMLIAASNEDRTLVETIVPPPGSVPGDKLFVEGEPQDVPDTLINTSAKGNIFTQLQPQLKTNSEGVAVFGDKPLKTDKGVFTCKLKGAQLS